jgi:gluconate:H+ symporter, GntP family
MTPVSFLIILAVAIGFLMLFILKIRMHPVFAIFLVAIGLGLALGNSLIETVGIINSSFGGTLKGIGITIILGSILAMGVEDTGAATSLANFFIRLFKGKNLELAPSLTAFIVSIPVFGDITMVLTAPIASVLAFRKKVSMSSMAAFTGLGLFLTHGLVPPTPGILAIALMYNADLGMVIFWGVIVSIVAFFATWFVLRKFTAKEMILPRKDFIRGFEPAEDVNNVDHLLIKEKMLPGAFTAMLPILIPVILISAASFAKVYLPEGSAAVVFLASIGDRVIALLLGVAFTIVLGFQKKDKVLLRASEIDSSANGKTDIVKIIFNTWVGRGLIVALLPLLITAMGGAMGGVLKAAPVIEDLGNIITASSFLPILIPFFISVILMTAVGSMTMAGLTSAAIVLPMMPALGLSPVAAVLSIGAGTMGINHYNNSGFWIMTQFFNLDAKQGFKYITIPTAVAAVFAIIALAIFNGLGLL